jgi:mannosyltransferase OCH1-like enzyme
MKVDTSPFAQKAAAAFNNFQGSMQSGRIYIPKQVQRCLPLYVGCIFFLIFLSTADFFSGGLKFGDVLKRESQSPLTTGNRFPRKIWQTWKVDPLWFEERDLNTARTWTTANPSHRYEVLTDTNDLYWVESNFGPTGLNRLDIVYVYKSLTAQIIKADLLRYLVMYVDGGTYTDIDVEALKPIDRFIPDRYNEKDVDLVIGVEIDEPTWANHSILGPKSRSFCQWTFMSKPRQPVMMTLVDNILAWLNNVAKQQKCSISEIVLDFDEVISGTGPSAFTRAILEAMSRREKKKVTWDTFHNLAESKLVGGVLVLTVEAFAAGQGHSNSGNHDARAALVKHHYHASGWPTRHPRYNHPVYGEVEKCNWDRDCVNAWDANKAAFEALSPEEQAKSIADHEAAIAAEKAAEEQLAQIAPF